MNCFYRDDFEFNYTLGKNNMACDQRYYAHVTADKHGLIMGSTVYFGKNKPSEEQLTRKLQAEAKFHIRVKNVK